MVADTGERLRRRTGATHQTGWTAGVALLSQYGGDLRFADPALEPTAILTGPL
jgi:hypothetical protein